MEYIEREAALAQTHEINIAEVEYRHRCIDPQAIREIPAADVAPVRRGKWKTVMCDDGYGEYTLFECDQCGSQSAQKRNYCSNCGAKMNGD